MVSCCSCFAGLSPQHSSRARLAAKAKVAMGDLNPAFPPPHRPMEEQLAGERPATAAAEQEKLLSFEVRLLSGAILATPHVPASTLVGALLAQLNSTPTLSAKLLHKGTVLPWADSLEKAGVEAGASLLLVLTKSPWKAALHGSNVEIEELCATRRESYSNAVILSPERSRSFAVRLLDNSSNWSGAMEMGFVSEDVQSSVRSSKFPTDLERALCHMGNSGNLTSITADSTHQDPRYKGNWTSGLVPGDIIRCSLEDEDAEAQRFSIHVNHELRLDRVFPTLTQDDAYYPAINLYGQTTKVEFLDI